MTSGAHAAIFQGMSTWLHADTLKGLGLCALAIYGLKYGSKLFGAIHNGLKRRH